MKKSFNLSKLRKDSRNSPWQLCYEEFKPAEEGLRETLCTLGNGYFGTRGAACESSVSRTHYPGTYIAGIYNKLTTRIAGRSVKNEDLINCPNWLLLTFRFEKGEWLSPGTESVLSYCQQLNLRRAILSRTLRFRDHRNRKVTVESQRIVHMDKPHLAAIKYTIIPENYTGWMIIRSGLDGTVENTGVPRYRQLECKHLRPLALGKFGKNGIYLSMRTSQSAIEISEAAKVRIFCGEKEIKPEIKILRKGKKAIFQELKIFVHKKRHYQIEKTVNIYTSRDLGIANPQALAIKSTKAAPRFDALLPSHVAAWEKLWEKFDLQLSGGDFAQKVLRLHTFHLLQSASKHNIQIDAGLPARGLHGEAYRGHIFWDVLFTREFFDFRAAEVSKALSLYRYRRLGQARKNARENWHRGAMFPWQSGSTGEEETQVVHLNPMSGKWGPDYSHNQRHISFAIAYDTWQYWIRTRDLDFLIRYGAELFLSIARFGASLAIYDSSDERYHTEGLMGPDEFHERFPGAAKPGFRDNAYTNILIVWTLLKAQEILTVLPKKERRRLTDKLNLTPEEIDRWHYITQKMKIVINKDGIIGQFKGYFKLKELNWKAYKAKYGRIQRIDRILKAEGKTPNEYKVAKQADVLMIFYLFRLREVKDLLYRLGYRFNREMLKRNYDYYMSRTSHGSTLSKVVHCYIAHLLGKAQEAEEWFLEVLKSDVYDTQGGTTPEGIHTGVMGASIGIVLRAFAGVIPSEQRIKIEPHLPRNWRRLKFKICCSRHWISFVFTRSEVEIFIQGPRLRRFPVPFQISGRLHYLKCGQKHKILLKRPLLQMVSKMVKQRILIVDGDIGQAEILEMRLKTKGYLVDCVRSYQQALEVLEGKWVDLIVLAVVLQDGMHGYQLFKEIKERKKLARIPTLVQSSKIGMRRTFEKMGAEGFLVKPYSVDLFLDKVEDILSKKTYGIVK
ncbi:response regulator [Candidatus Omnitrophota bacterium]